MDCFSFSGTAGDRIRVRVVQASGATFFPSQELVPPSGTTLCGPTTATDQTCALNKTGSHKIIVRDSAGTNTGGYVIAIQRMNNPTGCTTLTFGAAPTAGTISVAGEMDCYRFADTAGDQMNAHVAETSGTLI